MFGCGLFFLLSWKAAGEGLLSWKAAGEVHLLNIDINTYCDILGILLLMKSSYTVFNIGFNCILLINFQKIFHTLVQFDS